MVRRKTLDASIGLVVAWVALFSVPFFIPQIGWPLDIEIGVVTTIVMLVFSVIYFRSRDEEARPEIPRIALPTFGETMDRLKQQEKVSTPNPEEAEPVERLYGRATLVFKIRSTTDWLAVGLVDSKRVEIIDWKSVKGQAPMSPRPTDDPNLSHFRLDHPLVPELELEVNATFEVYVGDHVTVFLRKGNAGNLKVDVFNETGKYLRGCSYTGTSEKDNYKEFGFDFEVILPRVMTLVPAKEANPELWKKLQEESHGLDELEKGLAELSAEPPSLGKVTFRQRVIKYDRLEAETLCGGLYVNRADFYMNAELLPASERGLVYLTDKLDKLVRAVKQYRKEAGV